MPSTSPYQRAEASGSRTKRTTCATRLTLGMSMTRFLGVWWNRRKPGNVGDFGKLAPFFAPAAASIGAFEQMAVFRACQQDVGVCRVGADRPQRRVGLHREWPVYPARAPVRGPQEQRGRSRCAVADPHKQVVIAPRLGYEHPGIIDSPVFTDVGFGPRRAIVG